ncbi:phosphatidylglycerophosphatase A family protein [Magnetofaba australis]|uniref:Phosphatidylglycerophosphatase A n=1 Tax=Magnetofaba australis IT-1 TaxID=1434232 RepID=A0A1Y2K878_9PROT|nr:phosphatidylglycerophosphatase A [Magnetofaba australis]OSM06960.1 putative phosphatidylglycerophosphatase [Magnetofaba australis IT-1]
MRDFPFHGPAMWLATWGGSGLAPKAPGTVGTLAALPLVWLALTLGPRWHALITVVVSAVGVWAAQRACEALGRDDPKEVVIDEAAGMLLTLLFAPLSALNLALGFALFRLFDILKPGPVGWLDRHVHGGWGVMLDDLAAGALAALTLWGLRLLNILP